MLVGLYRRNKMQPMPVKKMPSAGTTISSLLKLSYEINNVRSRDDLINVINNSVSKLFAFDNINILLFAEGAQGNSYLLASPLPTTLQPPIKHELAEEWTVILVQRNCWLYRLAHFFQK